MAMKDFCSSPLQVAMTSSVLLPEPLLLDAGPHAVASSEMRTTRGNTRANLEPFIASSLSDGAPSIESRIRSDTSSAPFPSQTGELFLTIHYQDPAAPRGLTP